MLERLHGHEGRDVGVGADEAGDDAGDHRGDNQADAGAGQALELGDDRQQQVRAVEQTREGHGRQDDSDDVHHVRHTAAVEDLVDALKTGGGGVAVPHEAEDRGDAVTLEDQSHNQTGDAAEHQGSQRGNLQHDAHDEHDERDPQHGAEVIVRGETVADHIDTLLIHGNAGIADAEDGEDDQGDNQSGHGRPEDVLRVLVDVLLGDAGVEHDDIGHGGALIAEVRAADDRARGQGHRQAHAHRDTDEGHADRADRRPGGTGDAGEDRAHDDDERQVPRRVQKTEAEVDDVGHRAACHPRGDQHTDDQQD